MRPALSRALEEATRSGRALALAMAVAALGTAVQPSASAARVLERLTTQTGRHFAVPVPDANGIPNFAEIRPGLARGGQPTAEGVRFLRERGYRTIVSFRSNRVEREEALRFGIAYIEIPMRAGILGATPPTEEQVRLFLSVVTDSTNDPVFIHCRRGKDRTGVMSALYRIEACGWTAGEAVEEMRAFGFSGHYRRLLRFVHSYSPQSSASAR